MKNELDVLNAKAFKDLKYINAGWKDTTW